MALASPDPMYIFRHRHIGDNYPLWLPTAVGVAEMTFEETVRYQLTGPLATAEWRTLRAPDTHQGFLRLGPPKRMFAVSMFHALHCIGDVFPSALRQLILCSADTTLEPYDFWARDYGAEPVGVTRSCRDWSAVYEAAARNWDDWEERTYTCSPVSLMGVVYILLQSAL